MHSQDTPNRATRPTLSLKRPLERKLAAQPAAMFARGAATKPPVVPEGAAPVRPGAVPADKFSFNWVPGRRAPRQRYATVAEALAERDRLRSMGLDARTYTAHVVRG